MAIRLYDSLTRQAETLETREPGKVGIYCCGMTPYNYAHIGNMRTVVWFDQIRRYLQYRGYDVTLVMNYTDVDDKIIERANIEKIPPETVTAKYERAFEEDLRALGGQMPDIVPRATQHIEGMIEAIGELIDRGVAYEAGGNVWFAVERFDGYGKLSHRSIEDMRAGERIEPHPDKRHPLDFSLWKAAKEGEPAWDSPWGPGRPGWHIECSVMAERYLGMGFEIHGGGSDLQFPHHENEIAQAEARAGHGPFARYWLHAGMVQMDAEKMSKSLGNVALAREVLKRYAGEAVRYWMLQSSYRNQSVFAAETLEDASQSYARWLTFASSARHLLGDDMPDDPVRVRPVGEEEGLPDHLQRFIAAMDDDFNSAAAVAVVHDLVREANRGLEAAQQGDAAARDELRTHAETFVEITSVLGLRFPSAGAGHELAEGLLDLIVDLRNKARAGKRFDEADEIRARLADLGVAIEDTPAGTRWRVTPA